MDTMHVGAVNANQATGPCAPKIPFSLSALMKLFLIKHNSYWITAFYLLISLIQTVFHCGANEVNRHPVFRVCGMQHQNFGTVREKLSTSRTYGSEHRRGHHILRTTVQQCTILSSSCQVDTDESFKIIYLVGSGCIRQLAARLK